MPYKAGWRDENDLTNLIFFARHPELPTVPLKPADPNFKRLSAEWTKILDKEVWKAIKVSAENTDLVVSGEEVTDHHRSFFRGQSGKRLKKLVEDAAREVDLNPGLLGTIMMAETRRPLSYFSSEKVSSYHIGCDDFFEGRSPPSRQGFLRMPRSNGTGSKRRSCTLMMPRSTQVGQNHPV